MLKRWSQPNGYRQVLALGLPLVISMASTTVMHFTDRMFLANYSLETIAAAMPAGLAAFVFQAFFMGSAGYVNVFVAQYLGSGAPRRVGAALWTGIWFSIISGALLAAQGLVAEPLFALAGHSPEIRALEVSYFRWLCLGAGAGVLQSSLSCFFSGRGRTRPVMLANLAGAAVNVPLDYALINGVWGFPELGIVGAAWATIAGWVVMAALFALAIFTPRHERAFAVISAWRPEKELFLRLMRFGLPAGVQFWLDIAAITLAVFFVGRLGTLELAATTIAFSISTLSFLPMLGFSIAVSTLVGQAVGAGRPEMAAAATTSTIHVTLVYMGLVALVFLAFPGWLVEPFLPRDLGPEQAAALVDLGSTLVRYVALYTLFDAMGIIYIGALKGAGDSRFVMLNMAAVAGLFLVLPTYLGVNHLGWDIHRVWFCIILYLVVLGLTNWRRYRRGAWRRMRVVETAAPARG
ncbi:MAG: MATE family efflux transporter [Desulfarculus sp.]|nr:MATE family efflux transporter [Desulfarculus sp.]